MKRILTAILLIAVLNLTGCAWLKGGDRTPSPVKLYNDKQQRTAGGNVVASKNGVNMAFLAAVDRAIFEVTEDAKAIYGDAEFLRERGGYVVYALPDCELSLEQRLRSFRVNGILAAEWVPNPAVKAYVVCEVQTVDAELEQALRYGPEHIILRAVHWDRFIETMDACCHAHPLIPPRP